MKQKKLSASCISTTCGLLSYLTQDFMFGLFGKRSCRPLSSVFSPSLQQERPLSKGMIKIPAGLAKRAKQIQVLLMDVDGTLTDGSVTLLSQPDGTALEIKSFDAHDGQGLTLAHTAGLRTGVITGRESAALLRRANEMKMDFIYQKQPTKIPALEEILKTTGVPESAIAYVGDDLPDLPVMRRI